MNRNIHSAEYTVFISTTLRYDTNQRQMTQTYLPPTCSLRYDSGLFIDAIHICARVHSQMSWLLYTEVISYIQVYHVQ